MVDTRDMHPTLITAVRPGDTIRTLDGATYKVATSPRAGLRGVTLTAYRMKAGGRRHRADVLSFDPQCEVLR